MHEVNRYASVYTLVALSVDRLLASFYYCARWRTPLKGKIACVVIWVTSLVIALPYVIYSDLVEQGSAVSCRTSWPSRDQLTVNRLVIYFDFVAAFTVPVFAIFASYGVLAYRMHRMVSKRAASRKTRDASRHHRQHQQPHQQLQKQLTASIVVRLNSSTSIPQRGASTKLATGGTVPRRRPSVQMTRTVLAIVLIFVACHTPNSAMKLVALQQRERADEALRQGLPLQPSISEMRTFAYVNSLALVLLFLNSCVNPIIYGLSNRNFREYNVDLLIISLVPWYRHIICVARSTRSVTV